LNAGTWLNDNNAETLKKYFFNSPLLTDVLFNVKQELPNKKVKEVQVPGIRLVQSLIWQLLT